MVNTLNLSCVSLNNKNLKRPFKINYSSIIKNIDISQFIKQLGIEEVDAYKDNDKRTFSIYEYIANYKYDDFDWYASNINIYKLLYLNLPHFLKSWTDYLPEEVKPEWLWLFIGPKKSYTDTHIDVMNSSAWNFLISGEKKWTFYPPNSKVSKDLLPNNFSSEYSGIPDEVHLTQHSGDIIFTPSSWAHNVYNSKPTISITGNYINKINIYETLNYLNCRNNHEWYKILNYLKEEFIE
ncbi:cupin-like domain-containing protein [Staphylococcus coagulans]|uniref:cupin-like domain-containing protein n=1 Tax=Staphylococcus coagulans TaxID=74706 RepID=UPI0030EE02BE